MIFSTTALLLAGLLGTAKGQTASCSGTAGRFRAQTASSVTTQCITDWNRGEFQAYPDDFEGLENEVEIYQCANRGVRVIISNAIPDHSVEPSNNNGICEVHWVVELPLNPVLAADNTEVPSGGMIAMATNGVPAFGAMESDASNAVETAAGTLANAGYWYGHATGAGSWHFHGPNMGEESVASDTLLGYAMDGFPIYGPLADASPLDPCNGMTDANGNYRYHVRTVDQVDQNLDYCNGSDPETNWNYILGCYSGATHFTEIKSLDNYVIDADCVLEGQDGPTPVPTSGPTPGPTSGPTPEPTPAPTRRNGTPRPTRSGLRPGTRRPSGARGLGRGPGGRGPGRNLRE